MRRADLEFRVVVVAVAMVLAALVHQPLAAESGCSHVSGSFVFTTFTFTSATTASADFIVTGDLAGSGHAEYADLNQAGKGVFGLNGVHTIMTSGGTLVTSDRILFQFDPESGWARPNGRLTIEGGAGAFEGATGLLHSHGVVNLFTLEGALEFKGQVCVP